MNYTTAIIALVIVCAAASCRNARERPHKNRAHSAVVTTGESDENAAPLSPRSQYDLVAAITGAEAMDPDEAELRHEQIRRDWHGKRYRWRGFRIAPLCASAEQCNVLAFDLAGKDHKNVVQGWMPQLHLTARSFAALDAKCGNKKRCSFEFEGTLAKLVLSTQHLTSLQFHDVHIR